VLLRALAETPELRLRVLVGEDALDRTVDGCTPPTCSTRAGT
jgi:hypothetical protein